MRYLCFIILCIYCIADRLLIYNTRNMAFKKGQSGNPLGRTPGSKNKKTVAKEHALKAKIEDVDGVLSSYLTGDGAAHSLADDFFSKDLSAKDRLNVAEKLMQYRFPKMQSTAVDLTAKNENAVTLEQKLAELAG